MCSDEGTMKATKDINNTPEVSFERFKTAVRHILRVPKSKLIELEKKSGHSRSGSNGRNGKR
jgi:hypothetical protein